MIIHESFNSDLFVIFLEEHVISHTNSYSDSKFVLIMNNIKIHHDEIFIISSYFININELNISVMSLESNSHIFHRTLRISIQSKKPLQISKFDVKDIIKRIQE